MFKSTMRPFIVSLICSYILLTATSKLCDAYYIIVEPNQIDCYHEQTKAGTKLGFSFEVVGENFYNIDITIKDPNKVVVHEENEIDSGKYTIEAGSDGNYEVCFNNRNSHNNNRYIMFSIDTSTHLKDTDPGTGEEKKIANMVRDLHMAATTSKHEISYLVARDLQHKKLNESTNSTLTKWAFFEFFLLLIVSLSQIWFVRRFFETRRKV